MSWLTNQPSFLEMWALPTQVSFALSRYITPVCGLKDHLEGSL